MSRFRFLALMIPCLLTPLCASDWSAFRGAAGDGYSSAKNVPVEWDAEENIAWKIKLPGRSNGSPVLRGNRVFLTSASADGRQRRLHCFAAEDGSELWTRTVEFDQKMPTHQTNQYGGTTPAATDERVVVWHGSAGLHCYDLDGNEQWKRDFGLFRHQWGYGSSPVISGDRIILHSGPGENVFVAALKLSNGDILWKTSEPVENNGERNNANKYMGSWSTPVITHSADRTLAVCSMSTRTNGYDVKDGTIIWSCAGLRGPRGDLAYTSPVIAGDICVAMGGFKGPAYGFRMTGSGDITQSQRLWRDEQNPQRIGSGVFVDGYIYMANAGPNILQCIDPKTGELRWKDRGPGGAYWGSVVYADSRLYATDQNGTTLVFEPDPEGLKKIATNQLNDAGNSTPAFADGAIYIRTFRHLYRIGVR